MQSGFAELSGDVASLAARAKAAAAELKVPGGGEGGSGSGSGPSGAGAGAALKSDAAAAEARAKAAAGRVEAGAAAAAAAASKGAAALRDAHSSQSFGAAAQRCHALQCGGVERLRRLHGHSLALQLREAWCQQVQSIVQAHTSCAAAYGGPAQRIAHA